MLPLDEGSEEQTDGLLDVLGAQPAPLVPHQQAQDVQGHICHGCVWNTRTHTQHKGLHDSFPFDSFYAKRHGSCRKYGTVHRNHTSAARDGATIAIYQMINKNHGAPTITQLRALAWHSEALLPSSGEAATSHTPIGPHTLSTKHDRETTVGNA